MNGLLHSPTRWVFGLLLLTTFALVSCAPSADAHILSPGLGEMEVAERAGAAVVAFVPEAPPLLAELSEEEILAGLPEGVLAAMGSADPANGETIAVQAGCTGCHSLDPNEVKVGPTWDNMGNTAVARAIETGEDGPADYLYTSIADPNLFVVPDYQGVMLTTFRETLTDQDFADIIAFLLEQQQATE